MRLFSLAALLALALDQLSKLLVRQNLAHLESVTAIPGWLDFTHVHNYGAAWGVFAGQRVLLIVFTVFVVGFMLFTAREVARKSRLSAVGFGLILGGAVGNLIDRIWQGYVTDFFDLETPVAWLQTFPVFNIADSALSVGVVSMMLSLILEKRE